MTDHTEPPLRLARFKMDGQVGPFVHRAQVYETTFKISEEVDLSLVDEDTVLPPDQCFLCYKDFLDTDDDICFTIEWDACVHDSCVQTEAAKGNPEALIIKREWGEISWEDCSMELDNFWDKRKEEYDQGDLLVYSGEAYTIGDENSKDSFRGFGGQKFTLEFLDGTLVTSTNLWFRGKLPEGWKTEMPDNVKRFV